MSHGAKIDDAETGEVRPRTEGSSLDDRSIGGVWFLYSHLNYEGEQLLIESMLRRLDSLGMRINGVDRPGAHAYLYRLHGSG